LRSRNHGVGKVATGRINSLSAGKLERGEELRVMQMLKVVRGIDRRDGGEDELLGRKMKHIAAQTLEKAIR